MIYLANPCGQATVEAMKAGTIGLIDTPYQGKRPAVLEARDGGAAWCADNGAFTARWDAPTWWSYLVANAPAAASCLFATAPDVVGDHAATATAADPWLDRIRGLGYPVAYVAQNGLTPDAVPWDRVDVIFLGGALECPTHGAVLQPVKPNPQAHARLFCPDCGALVTEWKLGPVAASIAREAKARGKWVHMGRVNSERRMRYAASIGCDSVDGTFLKWGPAKNLPQLLAWVSRLD